MYFKTWKRKVNLAILEVSGVECDDLNDFNYREAWNRGSGPVEVAHDVLVANGYLR